MAQRVGPGKTKTAEKKRIHGINLVNLFTAYAVYMVCTFFYGFGIAGLVGQAIIHSTVFSSFSRFYAVFQCFYSFSRFYTFFTVLYSFSRFYTVFRSFIQIFTVLCSFPRFFAVLWLRGWDPDPGRPKTVKNRINRINRKSFIPFIRFFTVFHGFLRFCGSEAGIRTQADPKP